MSRPLRLPRRLRAGAALVFAVALAGCAATKAPVAPPESPDARAAVAAVQALFDAMAARDVAAAERTLLPDGVFVSVGGGAAPRATSTRAFLDTLGGGTSKLREWFTEEPTVRIDGDLATVFGAYAFSVDGTLTHTGVDALQLVRTAEGWRITGGVYSVVRPAPASPPAAPASAPAGR